MSKRIVIKIGGSSLFHPLGFHAQLRMLLDEFRNDHVYVIVGGGDLVESMRTIHRYYPWLNQEEMHWHCVELLDTCLAIASAIHPLDCVAYETRDLVGLGQGNPKPKACWVRIQSFYNRCANEELPPAWRPACDWNTTTDALAWLLAMKVHADRVVLLKQCQVVCEYPLEKQAEAGVVDSEIARLSSLNPRGPIVELRSIAH